MLRQLLFADDTALVAESAEQLQCLVSEFLEGVWEVKVESKYG